MKIRTGFVSNSSSGSFVAVIEKYAYDEMYKDLSDLQKIICDNYFEDGQFLDIKVKKCFIKYETEESYFLTQLFEDEEDYEEGWEFAEKLWDEFNGISSEVSDLGNKAVIYHEGY